jgi:hypothetical protein
LKRFSVGRPANLIDCTCDARVQSHATSSLVVTATPGSTEIITEGDDPGPNNRSEFAVQRHRIRTGVRIRAIPHPSGMHRMIRKC